MNALKNKYVLYPVLLAGLLLSVAVGYSMFSIPSCTNEVTQKPYVVIATAVAFESNALLERIETVGICRRDGIVYHVAEYGGKNILVYESGMGSLNAQKSTDATLSDFDVELLVFSGIAGAIDSTLPIGSVVVAEEWMDVESEERFHVDASLVEKARTLKAVRVVALGATFDEFVTTTENIPEGVRVVDMETAGIARTAEKYHVPFIAFRGISDYVGKDGMDDDFTYSASESAKVVVEFLSSF
jgi:adenosylhomocysteine nucleosidase